MNIVSLPRTIEVNRIIENVERYARSMATKPERVVLSKSVFAKLSSAAKTAELDFNGIPVVCQ